jgi:hypothetical protein
MANSKNSFLHWVEHGQFDAVAMYCTKELEKDGVVCLFVPITIVHGHPMSPFLAAPV